VSQPGSWADLLALALVHPAASLVPVGRAVGGAAVGADGELAARLRPARFAPLRDAARSSLRRWVRWPKEPPPRWL